MIPLILAAAGGYLIGDSMKHQSFADGGNVKSFVDIFKEYADNSNYEGVYDIDDDHVVMEWGKYGYGVSEEQQSPDYRMLVIAAKKFNEKYPAAYAYVVLSDKFNTVTIVPSYTSSYLLRVVDKIPVKVFDALKKQYPDDPSIRERINREKEVSEIDKKAKGISKLLGIDEAKAKNIASILEYSFKYKKQRKKSNNNDFYVYFDKENSKYGKTFNNEKEVFDYISTEGFFNDMYKAANPRIKVSIGLYDWSALEIKFDKDGRPFNEDGSTNWQKRGAILESIYVNANIDRNFNEQMKKTVSDFKKAYEYYTK